MKRIITATGLLALLVTIASGQDAKPSTPSLMKASFSKLPIYFVENRGVYPDEVKFYVQGADKTLLFTKDGITFRLRSKNRAWVVKLEFVGANPDVIPRGGDKQQAVFSYFKGPEKDWKTGLPTYSKIVYEELWPGIDLVYRGNVEQLKYEFVVKPGADPGRIELKYRGVTQVEFTKSGALCVETPVGSFEDAPPMAYQDIEGRRVVVHTEYELDQVEAHGAQGFRFKVGHYDATRTLVLDPAILLYCGYIGGLGDDYGGTSIAVDAAGNAYVTGSTLSNESSFPVKVGPDLTFNDSFIDVFVAKVNAQGTALVYCGYIGGAGLFEYGNGIAVDAAGNAYVVGWTQSTEQTFPVRIGPDLTHNGFRDTFVAKVNPQGTALVYCGYIGGNSNDHGHGIAIDAAGNAYVTGWTNSSQNTFPLAVGPDLSFNGAIDAFVAKVNPTGSALVYCGYIGGSGNDIGYGIAVDAAGDASVTGETQSNEQSFPVRVGPDLTFNGGNDAFVAKVITQGTGLVYCGYIGGSGNDFGYGIAVNASGYASVTGKTQSTEQTFPVKVGPDLTHNGGNDAFVAKVMGVALVYCGYIGGSGNDIGFGISIDAAGNAYVTGETQSTEQTFPVFVGPDLTFNGGQGTNPTDAFVAKVVAQGTLLEYCGYIGGSDNDFGYGIAVDATGNAFVAGGTLSNEQSFPVKVGPDLTFNAWPGQEDAFVAKVALTLLQGSGSPRPGSTVNLTLTSTDAPAIPFQLGSSLGTGPISIDQRKLYLSSDDLLVVTIYALWPSIFKDYRGVMNNKGQAMAAINIPNIPALIGLRINSAFVTLDPVEPSGIKSISDTFSFTITK